MVMMYRNIIFHPSVKVVLLATEKKYSKKSKYRQQSFGFKFKKKIFNPFKIHKRIYNWKFIRATDYNCYKVAVFNSKKYRTSKRDHYLYLRHTFVHYNIVRNEEHAHVTWRSPFQFIENFHLKARKKNVERRETLVIPLGHC